MVYVLPFEESEYYMVFEVTAGEPQTYSHWHGWSPASGPEIEWTGYADLDKNHIADEDIPDYIDAYCHKHHSRLEREALDG